MDTGGYDQGPLLAQRRIPIPDGIAAEGLQRVGQHAEGQLYVEVLTHLAKGNQKRLAASL